MNQPITYERAINQAKSLVKLLKETGMKPKDLQTTLYSYQALISWMYDKTVEEIENDLPDSLAQ